MADSFNAYDHRSQENFASMERETKILVVNDTPDQLELVSALLRQAGYRLLAALDGLEGFDAARRERPDLVISDVSMPRADGIELCRLIRGDASLHTTPILLVSALNKDTASIVNGLQAGADDYLEAPFDPMRLIAKVTRLIERARVEETLHESEARFRELFDEAPVGYHELDAEGRITRVNHTELLMLGYTAEEMLGHFVWEFSTDQNASRQAVMAKLNGTQPLHPFERNLRRKDGTSVPVLIEERLLRDAQGNITGIRTAIQDITKRKQAEESLRDSEKRFRGLIENISDGIALMSADGTVLYASPSTSRVLGYTPEAFVGSNGLELIHPDDREYTMRLLGELLQRPSKVITAQYRYLHGDGSWRWMESTGTNLLDEPSVQAIVANYRDITERKTAEEALREADQRAIIEYERLLDRIACLARTLGTARELATIYRALRDFTLESAPCCGIIITLYDSESRTRRAVYGWTDNAEVDLSELPPVPVGDGTTGRAIKSGSVIIANDYQAQLKKGAVQVPIGTWEDLRLPNSALTAPMTVMGRTVGCIEVQSYERDAYKQEHATAMRMAANLTANAIENVRLLERERAQAEQLRQSQKLEAVGQLAGGIAHDFNNLLTVITGYSDLALRRLDPANRLRHNIEQIRKSTDRAAALTRQLLAFSRKQVLEPKVLDLNMVVADVDKLLGRLIGENIDILTVLDPALGRVKADPGQIEQVIVNLAVNARDAMPRGGTLIIETKSVYLDDTYARHHIAVPPGHYVMLAVSDTGTGMDAKTQKQIFEPFFTTKEKGKGTGLGLSMVYGIVKQSGGNIWVYSEPGLGTTFKIYLPLVEGKIEPCQLSVAAAEMPKGTETVLLVEDNEMVRGLARDILKMEGYTVLEATHGGEALEICAQHEGPIDLLITDVVMPGMSGRELTKRLSHKCADAKVLYMSGYTDDAIVHHGVLDPGVAFLQKPFTPDALARKVREVLEARPVK